MIENQQPAKAWEAMIVTRRLILRAPELNDVPAITRIINDKVIARWASGVSYPYSAFEGRKFVNWAAARRRRLDGPGDLLITLRSNPGLVIGGMGLSGREGKYALGYWMNKAYRRRGYVNEAARSGCPRICRWRPICRRDFLRRQRYFAPRHGAAWHEALRHDLRLFAIFKAEGAIDHLPHHGCGMAGQVRRPSHLIKARRAEQRSAMQTQKRRPKWANGRRL